LTFKKADEVRDAARRTPVNRIVTETDAPFMAPEPLRGTVCGPEDTVFTAARLVEVFGLEGREAIRLLTRVFENARSFFDRDTSSWQDNAKAVALLVAQAKGVVPAAPAASASASPATAAVVAQQPAASAQQPAASAQQPAASAQQPAATQQPAPPASASPPPTAQPAAPAQPSASS
jgi:hypothetical protein